MTLFSRSTKANIFSLMVNIFMILYGIFGVFIAQIFGSGSFITLIISQIVVFIIPFMLYFFISGDSIKDMFKIKKISIANIIIIALISIFIQPILMAISAVSSYFFGSSTTDYVSSMKDMPIYMIVLTTAVFPAIFEELTYRGIVFSNLRNKSITKACVFTGLLFGMAHLNGEQFFYAFFMGAVLSYFVYKTGSILSSIVSHFTINFSQTMLMLYYLNTGILEETASQNASFFETLQASFTLAAFAVIPLLLLFYLFEYVNRDKKEELNEIVIENENILDYNVDYDEKLITVPFIANFAIFLFFVFFVN